MRRNAVRASSGVSGGISRTGPSRPAVADSHGSCRAGEQHGDKEHHGHANHQHADTRGGSDEPATRALDTHGLEIEDAQRPPWRASKVRTETAVNRLPTAVSDHSRCPRREPYIAHPIGVGISTGR
jgi:hypothetical protein